MRNFLLHLQTNKWTKLWANYWNMTRVPNKTQQVPSKNICTQQNSEICFFLPIFSKYYGQHLAWRWRWISKSLSLKCQLKVQLQTTTQISALQQFSSNKELGKSSERYWLMSAEWETHVHEVAKAKPTTGNCKDQCHNYQIYSRNKGTDGVWVNKMLANCKLLKTKNQRVKGLRY